MADPRHPRKFSEEFRRQVVEMHDNGKPTSEILGECDLGSSAFHRWVRAIHENGSTRASDNRTPARSPSKKGRSLDSAVDESTNKTLKKEMVYRETFANPEDLRRKLNDYVWWHDNERLHSTLGYMSPVEFRLAGLSL